MASHPDRVRRNYHTVEIECVDIAREHCWELRYRVTKLEVASWMWRTETIRAIAAQQRRAIGEWFRG